MSQDPEYRNPSETPPGPQPRSFATWIILLIVWTVGLISCVAWFLVFGYVLIRFIL